MLQPNFNSIVHRPALKIRWRLLNKTLTILVVWLHSKVTCVFIIVVFCFLYLSNFGIFYSGVLFSVVSVFSPLPPYAVYLCPLHSVSTICGFFTSFSTGVVLYFPLLLVGASVPLPCILGDTGHRFCIFCLLTLTIVSSIFLFSQSIVL